MSSLAKPYSPPEERSGLLRQPQSRPSTAYAITVAFSCAISGFLFGYDIGIIDSVLKMPSFLLFFGTGSFNAETGQITETATQADTDGNIVSSFLIGCVFGSMASSVLQDRFSRRRSILLGALIFIAGGILQAISTNVVYLCIARSISGVSIGILSSVTPVYLAEVAPAEERGRLVSIQQLMITIGILAASLVNATLYSVYRNDNQWRVALGIQALPAFFLVIAVYFLPFSPRWLMMQGRDKDALAVLSRLRGAPPDDKAVVEELQLMRDDVIAEGVGPGDKGSSWKEVLFGPQSAQVHMSIILQFFQQTTGINFILYFAADLFARIGINRDLAATGLVIGNAALLIVGTLPAIWAVERLGRRWLLITGALTMAAAHIAVTSSLASESSVGAYFAIAFVFVFTFGFSATWGPIVWVVQSETMPLRVRAKGGALATTSNWVMNAIIGKACPLIVDRIEEYIYLMFAVLCLLGGLYTYVCVPETKGVALEDVAELFHSKNKAYFTMNGLSNGVGGSSSREGGSIIREGGMTGSEMTSRKDRVDAASKSKTYATEAIDVVSPLQTHRLGET